MIWSDYTAIPALSQSQVKAYLQCPFAWWAEAVEKTASQPDKEVFLQGKLFESRVCGNQAAADDMMADPANAAFLYCANRKEPTLKVAYTTKLDAAVAEWQRQETFQALSAMPEQQLCLQGEIHGVPAKGLCDLADPASNRIIDIKWTGGKLDRETWNRGPYFDESERFERVPWPLALGWHVQAAWYLELARQSGWDNPSMAFAVCSDSESDYLALQPRWIEIAEARIAEAVPMMAAAILAHESDGPQGLKIAHAAGERWARNVWRYCRNSACWYCPSRRVLGTKPRVI